MPDEVELKLTVQPRDLPQLQALSWIRAIAEKLPKKHMLISVYYDTDQFVLRDKGVSLRVRHIGNKRLQTIKAAGLGALFSRKEWEEEISGDEPDFGYARGTALQPLLSKTLKRNLKPVFETRVQRIVFLIQQHHNEVELAIDWGTINAGRSSRRICEVELELKKGDAAVLFELGRRLSRTLPVRYGARTKPERGYALVESREGRATHAELILLEKDTDVASAFQIIGLSCLRHIARNEDAVLKLDAEGIHQMRVGIRRLRAAMSIFKKVVSDSQFEHLNCELKWLTGQLEPARNYEVFLEDSAHSEQMTRARCTGVDGLKSVLIKKRAAGLAMADTAVASERYRLLVLHVVLWLGNGKWRANLDAAARRHLDRPVAIFAREVIATRARKITKKLGSMDSMDAHHRHKLRIAIKKLRYASEFFGNLFVNVGMKRKAFTKGLEKLQDALGALNDISYNIVGIPIAAGALYPAFGVFLNPMVAALAMSLSSVSVIANALRLRSLSFSP